MTIKNSGSSLGFTEINTEIDRGSGAVNTSLSFLNGFILPSSRPGQPNVNGFYGLQYYQKNNAGNCNNGNQSNCNCNCGNINCTAGANCSAINCANCDTQKWLQTGNCNVGANPVYNCTSNQNCFSYNCNCNCRRKIICTKLFDLGLMKLNVFEADQAFGEKLSQTNPDIYNGYRAWAEIVVEWMDGKGPKILPWMTDEQFSVYMKEWAITWSYDIATPWAEEMAHIMGEKESGSLTGKMLMYFGMPVCKVVGVWQRWFGPSKKTPGFTKGVLLITILAVFKLVAELGRLIEKCIPNKQVA
jgi:hypothetical protein